MSDPTVKEPPLTAVILLLAITVLLYSLGIWGVCWILESNDVIDFRIPWGATTSSVAIVLVLRNWDRVVFKKR